MSGETERFSDRQEAFKNRHGGTSDLFFFFNNTSSLIETVVNTTHSILRSSDFSLEDRFLESRFSGKFTSVEESSSSGENLTSTSVDSIGMENTIHKVHSDTSHTFFGHDSFFGSPLPGRFNGVLDFSNVLNGLGGINDKVGTSIFGTE